MIEALRKVIKRLHYPIEVMLVCVRWYAAYPLSLRGDDGRARRVRRPRDGSPLVDQDLADPGRGVPPAQTPGGIELADGRDLHQSRWPPAANCWAN